VAALPLIVFDVNETLLDLETMEPPLKASSAKRAPCAYGSQPFDCCERHSQRPGANEAKRQHCNEAKRQHCPSLDYSVRPLEYLGRDRDADVPRRLEVDD
jgi:hypothetical protein